MAEKTITWYNKLKEDINGQIKQNGRREITGAKLNSVLNKMVDALGKNMTFGGMVSPATVIDNTDDNPVFYLALVAGNYPYCGNIVVGQRQIAILFRDANNIWYQASWNASDENFTEEEKTKLQDLPTVEELREALGAKANAPESKPRSDNLASFDEDGNLKDSGLLIPVPGVEEIDHVLALGENGLVWMPKPADGDDAYGVYEKEYKEGHGGSTDGMLTRPQWLASLKGEKGDNAPQPFKGWFTPSKIPSTGQEGDYCYVDDGETTKVWRWNPNAEPPAFEETTDIPDTDHTQTFASNESVNQVAIDGSKLVNPVNTADPNKPVLAKAEDVMQLKAKLGGVTAVESKLQNYTETLGAYDALGNEKESAIWYRMEVAIPVGTKAIRFLGVALRSGLSESSRDVGFAIGHYEDNVWVSDYHKALDINTENVNVAKEYRIDNLSTFEGQFFRFEVKYGAILTASNRYCYFLSGDSVGDMFKDMTNKQFLVPQKLLPAVKSIGVSDNASGNKFVNSSVQKTWFSFLKAGDRLRISADFEQKTYVYIGTAPINEPPKIVGSDGDMTNYPIIHRSYKEGKWEYVFSATENTYLWVSYRFAQGDPVFEKLMPITESNPELFLGSPSIHWSEFSGTDENISGKVTGDIYEIYDSLVTNYPLWIKRGNDIGYATLDSNLEIRHYTIGYQKATLQSSYAGGNIMYDDNGVNHDMPHIVISAGLHGDEKASVWGVAKACKEIIESNEPWAVFIKANFVIDIIPIVSPYTFNRNVRNMTVDGVSIDPNRDYSTFTLNESRAMRDFMLQTKAVCFIDCHNTKNSDTKERMFLSSQEGSINAEAANHLCMRLSSLMSMLIPNSYEYPEDPKVYFLLSKVDAKTTTLAYFIGEMNGILSFTMESPRNNSYDSPPLTCTTKASVLMSTLVENVIPAMVGVYNVK